MVGEAIANFDPYVGVAIGLFVVGLFAVMVYEKSSSSKSKHQQQQQHTAADVDAKRSSRSSSDS
ncbi:hypothetical protein NTE_01060 [Candidatus Nitrososphaera evergladensis SR1]|jgi:hypothetical protein|uniref:Uncharacterized protein n=2 Tax=Nitrososphaera TaxID=497726 RepID=A0A075MPJ2_9ARCH|nr:hypothetical protein NTE_01060 [Candidatus Nitrososphaera evergladensis SR1]